MNIEWATLYFVSVLRLESGYTVKYSLTKVIIQTLSISKNDTSSIVLPGWAMWLELIFRIALAAGLLFSSIRPAQLGVYWKIQYSPS